MGRAQALPAHARTEAEEPVRGKKALKKQLQRSIDKLVGAEEQLPEEDTERIRLSSCRRMVSCL